jgi:hypothetical protein
MLKNCGIVYTDEEIDGYPVKTYEIVNPLIRRINLLKIQGHLTFPKHFVFRKMSLYLTYEKKRRSKKIQL